MLRIYLSVFIVGGLLCVIAQILLNKTTLKPANILVVYITSGVILTAVGIYEKLVEIGYSGATVPLTGFGYALMKGTKEAVQTEGFIGIFTGGLFATAGGITAAIVFGYFVALIFNAKTKK
jgi:stage V sporulation protein AE